MLRAEGASVSTRHWPTDKGVSQVTKRTVLVINSGSSSIKYQLIDPDSGESLATGLLERVGGVGGTITHAAGGATQTKDETVPDHDAGLALVLRTFEEWGPSLADAQIVAVGHRVVQCGDVYGEAVVITPDVEAVIADYAKLAPLHNPPNLQGIRGAKHALPDVPHVAVFDTAFFQKLPAAAYTYAIPRDVAAKHRIRRYGAHGTSHAYVSAKTAEFLGRDPADFSVIVLHLGNGASVSAVRNGHAIETSMGLTPLEGLVMGTRSGDLDPAILIHLCRVAGMTFEELDVMLNRRSGLLGLSGHIDMRDVQIAAAAGDENAQNALDVYAHRIKTYVGSYYAHLGHLDAIAFTAGIGENAAAMRAAALTGLEELGIAVDPERNAGGKREPAIISPDGARVTVCVVPTNEELSIARQAIEAIEATGTAGTVETAGAAAH